MDRLKQIESFVAVATKGSLTAAAHAEGVAPAVIGRRIDALEERLGVKLLVRTTRRITLTHEGSAFLEDCQRLLADLANAEASVSAGGVKASGHLRITAPAGFGRRHVAPLVPALPRAAPRREPVAEPERPRGRHRQRRLRLRRARRRPARLAAWSACAWPTTAACAWPRPPTCSAPACRRHPADLTRHQCLTLSSDASQTRGWAFVVDGEVTHLRPSGRLDCSDGQVLHDWCLRGLGIAWRSTWEVEADVAAGRLQVRAGGLRRAAERHLRRVSAAQAPAAAGAAVDRLRQAQLRRPAVLDRWGGLKRPGARAGAPGRAHGIRGSVAGAPPPRAPRAAGAPARG